MLSKQNKFEPLNMNNMKISATCSCERHFRFVNTSTCFILEKLSLKKNNLHPNVCVSDSPGGTVGIGCE